MNQPPLFSILICTTGKSDLTKGAIQSILSQTCQDFEIIVTDTSGTNNIRDIVNSFRDSRVHFYEVPERDPSSSWNFAYTKSHGNYVLWYDDDNCLVPWALQHFKKIIEEEQADIVSGNHAYYFGPGNRHNPNLQNALGARLPFTLKKSVYNPHDVIRAVYDFALGSKEMPARWHSAATFVSREICEKVRAQTGSVITPHLWGNFHFHPLLFAFAKKPIYDDRPLCLIGKFASSITQQWSNVHTRIKQNNMLPYRFTEVSARTLGNTTAECYLQAQELLPELKIYPLNFEKFYWRYLSELILIDLPIVKHMFYWKEFWKATDRLSDMQRKKIRMALVRGWIKSLLIRLLRFVHLWNWARTMARRFLKEDPNRKFVDLNRYGINSINECAQNLAQIFRQEFQVEIKTT